MEGLTLLAGREVARAAFPEDREALLLVAEGVGVLEPEARGLGVLADVLEHAGGLLELAGLFQGQRSAQLSALTWPAWPLLAIDVVGFARASWPAQDISLYTPNNAC